MNVLYLNGFSLLATLQYLSSLSWQVKPFSSSRNWVRAVCLGKWLWMCFRLLRVGKDNVLKMSQPLYIPEHFHKDCKEQGSASLSLQSIHSMNCLYQLCIAKLKCFHFVIKNNLNMTSMVLPQQQTKL